MEDQFMATQLYKIESITRYNYLGNIIINNCSFPYAVIKGEPLSVLAYNQLGQRRSADIDILVDKSNLKKLENILLDNGFTAKTIDRKDQVLMRAFSHQITPFTKEMPFSDIIVDLNYDIFWGEYEGKRININEFLEDTIELDVYGYNIKTLPPLKSFIQLVLHHYKEMNSIYHLATHKCIRRSRFNDIYNLLKNNANVILLEDIEYISIKYQIKPYVYYVLYYTYYIFKDNFLKPYVDLLYDKVGDSLVESYGLTDKERKKWNINIETRFNEDNLFQFISQDLEKYDLEKLERNIRLFGRKP